MSGTDDGGGTVGHTDSQGERDGIPAKVVDYTLKGVRAMVQPGAG
jgi:hypothetical protein